MMQVMGMRQSVVWLVWLLISGVTMLLVAVLLTMLLKLSGLMPRSNPILLFGLLASYCASILMYW